MEGKEGVAVLYSSRFVRSMKRVDSELWNKANERIKIFEQHPFDMRLKTHKLTGKNPECWAFRITGNYRIIFKFVHKNLAVLEALFTHDEYDRD